jgi:hypothetical protein
MPAVSDKQKRFMDAAAHNPAFAKAAGVPMSVAKDFSEQSKGMSFGKGAPKSRADVQAINKPKTNHGESGFFSKGGKMATKKLFGGKESMKEELAEAKAIKSGKITPMQYAKGEKSEPMKKMAKGGMAHEDAKMDKAMMQKAVNKHESRLHKGQPMTKLAKGGTFRSSANGVAQRGKTKATQIKMARGGCM